MPTPHHKPKNVTLTNNLRWTAGRGPAIGSPTREPKDAKPHHETSEQAASRALARMLAIVSFSVVPKLKRPTPTWNPARPRKRAPHYRLRNVRLTNALAVKHGTSTAARITTDAEWEAFKRRHPERFPRLAAALQAAA
jgi:hypothetical protein